MAAGRSRRATPEIPRDSWWRTAGHPTCYPSGPAATSLGGCLRITPLSLSLSVYSSWSTTSHPARAQPKFTVTLHDTTDGFSPLRSSSPIRLRSARANPLDPSADHRISPPPFPPFPFQLHAWWHRDAGVVEAVGIDTVVSSGAGIRVRVTR